jgi:cellulose synthase/poly-beta-1,6-N-acetylglucosamine synthase-like glycosyltransferase
MKQATGEILVFTDADCRPDPDWIRQIVLPFADAQIGIVVGELNALAGESLLEKYAERVQMMSPHFLLDHPFYPYGQTANLAIRRIIFSQIGLFRPYLTSGGDADICWRIQQATDWQLAFAPRSIVCHRHRSRWRELRSQWQRYGRSNRYLHDLHGVDLMPSYTHAAAFRRIVRWLLKEIPRDSLKILTGEGEPIDLIRPPIDLFTYRARSQGQKNAILPTEAREIEWLQSEAGHPAPSV